MSLKITRPCPICKRPDTVRVLPCCHEDTCSVDYTVQCLGKCMEVRGRLGFFSPSLLSHAESEEEAIKDWNDGKIGLERRIYSGGPNYMGD